MRKDKSMDSGQLIMDNKNDSQLSTVNSQLPKGWKYGTLDDVVKKGSSNISLNKVNDDEGEYPLYGAKGYVKNVSFFQQESDYLAIIKDGAGIGRVARYPAKSSVVATMQYLIPKDGFDIGFIEYFLRRIDFEKHRSGSTIPHVYFKDYKSEAFPLIPLPEQQRIVKILNKAFVAINKAKQNAEQNLRNAKEVFENYLQGVFENKGDDWEEKTLKEISEDFGRGKSKHRPRNDKKLYGGDYPFIQTGDVRNCEHYITDYSQTYNDTGLAQSKLWPTGAICITIAANIAETGILSFDACFPDSVIGIVVNTRITNVDFVEYLLQSFKVNIQSLGKGSAQDNINMGTFEKKLFPFPSIQEQKQIVKKLNKLSAETQNLESIYQQKLNNLDELKKSILQKAFRGEL